jgi:class 3 adenylate cyclase/DNA-binding SARP family transcriptional activator
VEFGILGPLAASREGRELRLGGAKERAVLAMLLLRANELVPTARLVDELWGEQPPPTAVKAVQVHVSNLRKLLGEGVLQTRPTGYMLELDADALDSRRFEGLLEQGRRLLAGGAAEEAARVLRDALALWRGPPLADFQYESFARNEIGRLEELRLVALEQRLEADLALGRGAEVVGELEALVRDHPLRENLCGLLILALYRAGRQADALAAYQDARARLVDELGLDPSQALQRLEKAILVHDPSLDLAVAPAPAPMARPHAPPQVEPAQLEPAAETRKTVTVLFCDVVAYTELGERLDPEALRHLMSRYFENAAAVVERHGGTVEKFVGDEVMAVFGVPAVREDDALRAVRAALELRQSVAALETELDSEARLQVRIGINTGEVVAGNPAAGHGFVTGDPVSVGKRLEQAAAPSEILLGEETHALVAHAVEASPAPPLKVKGKRRELTAFRLESVDAEATAVARRGDARFVGRERELERLRELYARVVAGEGARLVTIVGEPGIGKSRLAREALAGLEPEPIRLVGRCPPYGEGVTFWPLRELLHQAGRDESVLAGSSHEVFATVRRLLVELAGEQPLVVVFDDVHWAEATFLDLVEYLAARLGAAPVLLLCLARPQFAEQRPAWLQPPAETLVLDPLSEADSTRLLESLGAPTAVRARIAEAAEGNPLFAEQLATIADEYGATAAMPGSIRAVLHERLDRLDRDERSTLERAAVAGRSFTVGAVLELAPPEEREHTHELLLALVRKRFVRADTAALEEGFRFQHALIRDAAYEGMPKATAAGLHERMAARLEEQGGEDAVVGNHLEQAFGLRRQLGRLDAELGTRAGRLLHAAGQEAFGRSDLPAAISLFERAHELLPADDAAQPALLTELGSARMKAGDFAGAEADLDRAVEVAAQLGERAAELHALVERQFARSFVAAGASAEESVRIAREVMPELERLDDELGLARAWWLLSEGDVLGCRWRERAAALEQALAHAHRANAGLDFVSTLSGLIAQALLLGPTPVAEAIARVEELLVEPGADRAFRATVSTSLAGLLAMQGAFEDARLVYADAVATYAELGLRLRRAAHAFFGAQIELLAGDTAAAEQELRAAGATLGGFGTHGLAATHGAVLADLLCTLGRLDEAEALARELAGSAPEDDLMPQALWRSTLGRVLAARGELEEAERLLGESLRLTEGVESPDLRAAVLAGAAEVEAAQGRAKDAGRRLEEALLLMEAKGNVVAVRRLEAALAVR